MKTIIPHTLKIKNLFLLVLFFIAFTAIKAANPVITITGANPTIHQVNTPYTDLGATAIDENGNDISSSVQIISGSVNANTMGKFYLTYSVTDGNNQTSTAMREVEVTDLIPPVINTLGTTLIYVCRNDFNFSEPTVNATDNYFPTVQVMRTGTFDITVNGNYIITYTATDMVGNQATYTRTIRVVECIKPVVDVLPVKIKTGDTFDPFVGVSVTDFNFPESDFFASLNGCKLEIVSSDVDVTKPGTYQICYRAINGVGLVSDTICRTVIVENALGILPGDMSLNAGLNIYPNPNNGVFEVVVTNAITPDTKITITNITGQVVKTIPFEFFNSGRAVITLENFETGVYFILMQNNAGIAAKKIAITR